MAYLFEAYFDPEADAKVRHLWDVLNARGVSDSNLRNASTPHLTLFTVSELDEEMAQAALGRVAQRKAFDLPLVGAAYFPGGRATLYLPVTPSTDLLNLREACQGAARVAGATPGEEPWMPHVSLARRLMPDALPDAIAALLDQDLTIPARMARIGLLRDRPIVRLGEWDLSVA